MARYVHLWTTKSFSNRNQEYTVAQAQPAAVPLEPTVIPTTFGESRPLIQTNIPRVQLPKDVQGEDDVDAYSPSSDDAGSISAEFPSLPTPSAPVSRELDLVNSSGEMSSIEAEPDTMANGLVSRDTRSSPQPNDGIASHDWQPRSNSNRSMIPNGRPPGGHTPTESGRRGVVTIWDSTRKGKPEVKMRSADQIGVSNVVCYDRSNGEDGEATVVSVAEVLGECSLKKSYCFQADKCRLGRSLCRAAVTDEAGRAATTKRACGPLQTARAESVPEEGLW